MSQSARKKKNTGFPLVAASAQAVATFVCQRGFGASSLHPVSDTRPSATMAARIIGGS